MKEQPISIDQIQLRMALLSRELAQFRLKSRLVIVLLAEQHSEEPGPLAIHLSGIAREVEAILGFVEARLLEASDMTDGAVRGEIAAMTSGLIEIMSKTSKSRAKQKSEPGLLDELVEEAKKKKKRERGQRSEE